MASRIACAVFAILLASGRTAPLRAQEPSIPIYLPVLLRDRTPPVAELVGHFGGEKVRTVVTRGQFAWVGQGERVVALDVSDPATPRPVGTTGPLGGDIVHLRAVGTRGYAVGAAGLHVLELAERRAPRVLGHLALPSQPRAVAAVAGTALVALGQAGLAAVDVSNPAGPRLGAIIDPGPPQSVCSVQDVHAVGRFAFVAAADCGLRIFEFDGPDELRVVWMAVGEVYDQYDISVSEGYAYLTGFGGSGIYDVHDPSAPRFIGELEGRLQGVQRPRLDPVADVYVAGGRAYVSSAYDGSGPEKLWVLDVADPRQPRVLAAHALGRAGEVRTAGDRVYVTGGSLSILDAADPAAPRVLGRYELFGGAHAVDLVGNKAYVVTNTAAGASRLAVLDVTRLEAPVALGETLLPGRSGRWPIPGLSVHGRQAYVVSGGDGVFVFDIGDPTAPRLLTTIDTPGIAMGLDVADDRLYIADRPSIGSVDPVGVFVFDMRDPARPRLSATIPGSNDVWGLAVANGTLFVSDNGLQAYRLAGDDRPDPVANLQPDPNGSSTGSIAADADRVYIGSNDGLIRVFDFAVPTAPRWLGSVRANTGGGIVVANERLYTPWLGLGVSIMDVVDPGRPFRAGFALRAYEDSHDPAGPHGSISGFDVEGDRILFASANEGLLAYRMR